MSTKPLTHSSVGPSDPLEKNQTNKVHETSAKASPNHEPVAGAGKPFPFWMWLGTVAVSFVAGKYLVLGHSEGHGKIALSESTTMEIPKEGLAVTTKKSQLRPVARKVQAVGTLHGYEEVTISSKVDGRVSRIYFDLAAQVKPGELLLELDPIDAELAVQQSEKMLQTELAKWGFAGVPARDADVSNLPSVVSAKLRFEHAESRLRRTLPLRASNAISIDDMEQIQSEAKIMESDWRNQLLLANSAVATIQQKAAELEIARQRLADCKINVPVPTLNDRKDEEYYSVTERLVSEGSLLRPGTEVFRLVLGRSLKLRLAVPEVNAGQVRVGQDVEVHVASSPDVQPGTVTTISPAIDRSSRTFLVEVTLPNLNGVCKPGGFAKADILVDENSHAYMIPLEGVYSLAGNNKVFVAENGKAREFQVTLGLQENNWIEIQSPAMPPDAEIVTSGQRLLSEGIPVAIRTTSLEQPATESSPISDEVAK